MSLITFNISIIVMFVLIHIAIKPIYKKRYPFKLMGTLLIGIGVALIFDLVPLACYLLIKINQYIN